jgi:hypothetical protein
MDKISSTKFAQVLQDAQRVLLSVTSERDKLAEENAAMKSRIEAEKLASTMHEKGCRLDTEYSDLVSELEKEAEQGRLPIIQQAVEMVGPNMGLKGISTHDDVIGGGASSLENYLIGDVG